MRKALLFVLFLLLAPLRPPGHQTWPILVGRATFYGLPVHLFAGNYTKGGDLFDPEAMAFAITLRLWEEQHEVFANKDFWVCSYRRCIRAKCWDTGPDLEAEGIAIDLTPRAFTLLFGGLEQGVGSVRIYKEER